MFDGEVTRHLLYLLPGLVAGCVLIVTFVLYLTGKVGRDDSHTGRKSSAVIPQVAVDFLYWIADAIARGLADRAVGPTQVSAVALGCAVGSGVAIGAGYLMAGTWLLVVAGLGDALDGLVARRRDRASRSGAFWDSFLDRIAEAAVFFGLAYYGAGGLLTWLAIWALIASFCVSYARARGDSLGFDCERGLMQRGERLLTLIVALFLAPPVALWLEPGAERPSYHVAVAGVGIIAVLASVTAANRARWIAGVLDRRDAERPGRGTGGFGGGAKPGSDGVDG